MEEEKKKLVESNIGWIEHDLRIMKDVIEKHGRVRKGAIQYNYELITIAGIVAGFGFTGIGRVETIFAFLIGEALLFSAIVVDLWFVKKMFLDEAKLFATYIDKLGKAINKRRSISLNIKSTLDEMKKSMNEISLEESKIFDDDGPHNINSDVFFNTIICLFIFGTTSLLLSFINFYQLFN